MTEQCPCCSGKMYHVCCEPIHKGASPKNALELMRARYSAYAKYLPDYIIATTHPANLDYSTNLFSWKRRIAQFSRSSFHKLEIIHFQEKGSVATVTFTAALSQDGQDCSFTEKSYFDKIGSQWLYRCGQENGPDDLDTIMPVANFTDPIIRRIAQPVTSLTKEAHQCVEELLATMISHNAVGLAAPQISQLLRIFVIRPPVQAPDGDIVFGPSLVCINPILSKPSSKISSIIEGCCSIPTIRAKVQRPENITVSFTSIDGSQVTQRFSGWEARIIQHEYDHLDGKLFIDALSEEELSSIEAPLQELTTKIEKWNR